MQNFLHEINTYENYDDMTHGNKHIHWLSYTLLICVSVVATFLIICLLQKYRVLIQSVGKRLANDHDLEGVNEKQLPSTTLEEDIEMSVVNTQTVNNSGEGQSFKRTDAMMAWAK